MDSPSFSHFRLPSQSYPAVAVSDESLQTGLPRCALRGSLDPTTGIFYRAPEHTRIRTAQACDKCRVRKAKCSGDHPVCERCHIRGLTCHYAPERHSRQRSKVKGEQDAVPNRRTGRHSLFPSSSDIPPPAGSRSKSEGTSTSHRLSSPHADADCFQSGHGDRLGQRTGGMVRPRHASVTDAEVRPPLSSSSLPGVDIFQSTPPFSRQVLDPRYSGPERPQGGHYPILGTLSAAPNCVGIIHKVDPVAEPVVCEGVNGKGSLEGGNDFDLDPPRIEGNALALRCNSSTNGPSTPPRPIFTLEAADGAVSCVPLAGPDPAYIHPGLTRVTYPEGVDGARASLSFGHPPRSHRSGPRPWFCFGMSSVDLVTTSNNEGAPICCPSDTESPGWTPSTSSSASPILTRASSDGLPTTPTDSYPNSPFAQFPHLGPIACDPSVYPRFAPEAWTSDTGTKGQYYNEYDGGGMFPECMAWQEIKHGARSFGRNSGLSVGMDSVL